MYLELHKYHNTAFFNVTQISYMNMYDIVATCTTRECFVLYWTEFYLIWKISLCTGIVQCQVWLSGLNCLPARRRLWMRTLSWTTLTSRGRGSSNRPRTRQPAMMKLRSVVQGITPESLYPPFLELILCSNWRPFHIAWKWTSQRALSMIYCSL